MERLAGLFDYAGMFPPEALSFQDALAESALLPRSLRHPELVANDMVLTPMTLPLLSTPALDALHWSRPCRVCLVGLDMDDVGRFPDSIRPADKRVVLVSAEVVIKTPGDVAALVPIKATVPAVYAEPRWDAAAWAADGPALFAALRQHGIGLKVRCAGPHALDAATLAMVVANVPGIPWKATQGLHHPLPGPSKFGFLNVVTAFRLREALGDAFSQEKILACLEETDWEAFPQGTLAWRGVAIEAAGTTPFHIGSCSLREPDNDLEKWRERPLPPSEPS